VYEQRDALGLDEESRRLVEVVWQQFMLAGATLGAEQKAQLKALNREAAQLTSQFNQRLLAADKAGGLLVSSREALAGLSEAEVAAAAQAAREKGQEGRWLIALLNTTQQPALQSLERR
ncbi:dipeptidyl carboxypeptidase II, partial [Leptospira borgpetersenii serovar Ballum]|nr:dipeptidyl carboxypeptidase II [Leptospira borgpetersenii serovar Ballum]